MDGRVVIAGGTGFIGTALSAHLAKMGYEVVVLGRRPTKENAVEWDGKTVGDWKDSLKGAVALVNLAGARIDRHWSASYRQEIINSRVFATKAIGEAIAQCADPPEIWVNASAIGYYGNRGERELHEDSAKGEGFLPEVCTLWERTFFGCETPKTAKAAVRIGIVLGRTGGALPVFIKLCKSYLGSPVGTGRQYMSWIHIGDLVRLISWIIEKRAEGVYNGTAPVPVTNREFMAKLTAMLHRPLFPRAPGFALRLLEMVGGPPAQISLEGQRVVPWRALEEGFPFRFGTLDTALYDLLST